MPRSLVKLRRAWREDPASVIGQALLIWMGLILALSAVLYILAEAGVL